MTRWKPVLLVIVAVAAGGAAWPVPAAAGDDFRSAKALFARYASLVRAFDPAVTDLYDDAALIRNLRLLPDGQVEELTVPARTYKDLVRQAMPLAKIRGDVNTFSGARYARDGGRVRIRAVRHSELRAYSGSIELLVGPSSGGDWKIFEEISESKP
jgi:hypothetical protein